MTPLLEVRDLQTHDVTFGGERIVKAVDGGSSTLHEGAGSGGAGGGGRGRSTLCQWIGALLPAGARTVGGAIACSGEELTTKRQRQRLYCRGAQIPMTLQDPLASVNPL